MLFYYPKTGGINVRDVMAVYLLFIFVSVGCIDLDDLGSLYRRINKGSIENMERKIMMNKRMRKKY